jgi:polyphosphate kinase 2 (PPK2 family)
MKFVFGLSPQQLAPILNMQQIARDDTVLRNFTMQSLQQEDLMRRQHTEGQAAIMARETGAETSKVVESKEKAGKESARTYAISYFNPELGKTEVLEQKADVRMNDPATQTVEEAVAAQSVLSIYRFVGTPLMRTEVVPWKLQQILDEREYGTPPPPPSGAGVTPLKVVQQKESDIVAEKKRDDIVKAAFAEVVLRKERCEAKVDEEILLLEETVEALRKGGDIDKIIARLPPLSRARYTLAMRKRNLGRYAIINLLLQELFFLRGVKKKLELFTLDDLVNMFKLIRGLQR